MNLSRKKNLFATIIQLALKTGSFTKKNKTNTINRTSFGGF